MTRSFWYHFAASIVLFTATIAVVGLAGIAGTSLERVFLPGRHVFPSPHAVALLLTPVFLWVIARLAIRVNRSYGATSYLALYAVALSLPVLMAISPSPVAVVSLSLIGLAIGDILDSRIAPKRVMRAGIYLGVGSILEPGLIFAFLLLLIPVFLIQRNIRRGLHFVGGMLAPIVLAVTVSMVFGLETQPPLLSGLSIDGPSFASARRILSGRMTPFRYFADTYFLAAYLPFLVALLSAITIRAPRIDRTAVLLTLWLMGGFSALGALGVLPSSSTDTTQALTFTLMILAATVGAGVLESLNDERGARVWMLWLGGLFMAPPLIGWVHLIIGRASH